jgi:actin-related protein 8
LIDRSYDLYDGAPNDPTSLAQTAALTYASENYPTCKLLPLASSQATPANAAAAGNKAPPATASFHLLARLNEAEPTPRSSIAGSPAPEGTPKPDDGTGDDANGTNNPNGPTDPMIERLRAVEESDRILPVMPLDTAILACIKQGAKGDERKMRDFLGGIMVVGGGAKMPGFNAMLELRLRQAMPGFTKEILVGMPPRELDQQLVGWKGGSVFARLSSSGNDSWIYQKEYELLGSKLLSQKLMFAF